MQSVRDSQREAASAKRSARSSQDMHAHAVEIQRYRERESSSPTSALSWSL